jgi:CRISPR/Cas system CMR-associated protein Cmr5 small subunit
MNEEITNRIEQYLELDTNYAIIINGDYGIGKTHYIKNQLFPKIAKLKIPHSENEETYIPILISLFGAKSIEDIQNQIFVELYPVLKKRGVKIVAGLGNTVLKYFGSNLKDLLSETGTSSESLTDYRKILICIDDIDRKSPELDLKEVFGFVNNLVENLNAKILLIANEDELRKEINTEDVDNYSLLREKVIGISINFSTNVSLTFDRIIESNYKAENKSYFDFLNNHKKTIVNRISQNKDNLRNLLFFLEHFKIVFKETTKYLSSETKFDSIKNQILETILDFTLPISIEYKLGKLNTTNFSDIIEIYQGFSFNLSRLIVESKKEDEPKTYPELFKEKYLPDDNIQRKYFDSIFNYITGKTSFKIEQLSSELNSIYKFEDNTIPEREKLISKLSYWDCVDLKHSEYRSLTASLLEYVDKGEFSLEQYPTVFHYATRFDNLLNYNIENLKKRFKKGIQKGKADYNYVRSIHFRLSVDKTSEFYEDLKEIVEYCIEINNGIKENQELKELTDIFSLFSSNFNSFLEKVEEMNNEFMFTPYFTNFDFNKTWRTIKKLDNSQIINLAFYFQGRYRKHIYEKIYPEKEFLENLNKKVENLISNKSTNKLKKATLKFFSERIMESIKNFPE